MAALTLNSAAQEEQTPNTGRSSMTHRWNPRPRATSKTRMPTRKAGTPVSQQALLPLSDATSFVSNSAADATLTGGVTANAADGTLAGGVTANTTPSVGECNAKSECWDGTSWKFVANAKATYAGK